MAKTAEELAEHIEQYLNTRLRPKNKKDRTSREELLLQQLESAIEELIAQGRVKRRQAKATLGSIADLRLADLIKIATERRRLQDAIPEDGEDAE